MTHIEAEIFTQPDCWRQAAGLADSPALPGEDTRVAVVGCGTSWHIATAYAILRERRGHGETDAFPCSEFPHFRRYDRVVAISRSGATAELLLLLRQITPHVKTTVITSVADSPAATLAAETVLLPFAAEQSIVQTRFPTSVMALLRTHLGVDITAAAADAEETLRAGVWPLPPEAETTDQITFLGIGWTVGLAHEAALKCRVTAGLWAESYPIMEWRHGPMAIARPGRLVWGIGNMPSRYVGSRATVAGGRLDPMAELVRVQLFAVDAAKRRGLDPDRPPHLTWAVTL